MEGLTSNVLSFSTLSSPSLSFKLFELFEKLNVKLCLVPLYPYSKKPAVSGWTDPDYNDLSYGWARHNGNAGIIPGRSSLLIVDCDNEETVNFFTKLAQEIDLQLDTLVVQTRRGKHFYYYCEFSYELEKKQFSFDSIKLDLLAGNKCQVVGPFSVLKLDKEGNILDPRSTDYILFEYTPLNIPQRLPEITKEKYEALLAKLESFTQKSKKILQLPPYVEKSEERELTDEEIEKLVEVISEHFVEGQRQNLILYLTGYLRKELNISEESILKLYEHLQPIDDPKDRKARIAAIKKTYEKDLENITGKIGLSEILGEETAKELCKKIEQALGIHPQKNKKKKKEIEPLEQFFQNEQDEETIQQITQNNYIYVEINRKAKKFARCNYNNLTIELGAFEKNDLLDKYFFVVHYKVFDCCIDKIYVIENPLTKEENFEVHFISKIPAKPRAVLKGSIQEIWEEMRAKTSYVLNTSVGLNVLTAVFNHYLKQGWYEKKQEELPPGFYYLDGQLIAQSFEEKEYTKEDLQQAALFLNEYIYSHPNPMLIASIIRAGLLLPFSFAQKQMVIAGKLRKRMKYLFLTGETKTGKTTTALLLACMWNQNNHSTNKISYASFNTEARAGKHLSNSTHILIVDEVSKDLETSSVKELLKYAQEDIIARTTQSKTLKQIYYPALSAIIMTSNSHFPEDPALLERFLVFRFRKLDKISATDRAKYEREDFNKLWPIAQFVWNHIKKNGLRDDYINYATEILKALYQEAEVEGYWLDWAFFHDTAETEEEQEYKKEMDFFSTVHKFFLQHTKQENKESLAQAIYNALLSRRFGRWIWADDKLFVYISRDFLLELKRSYRCEIKDLEELREITDWKKMSKRWGSKEQDGASRVWVLQTTIMELFYRLNLTPRLLTAYEFQEWINNRLPLEFKEEITSEDIEEDTIEDTINDKNIPF